MRSLWFVVAIFNCALSLLGVGAEEPMTKADYYWLMAGIFFAFGMAAARPPARTTSQETDHAE